MRVVLAAVGSRGDVQPMLALGQAFVAHGHDPLVAAPPNFENWVRSLGFDFAPLGVDMQAYMAAHSDGLTGNPVKMLRMASRYFNEQIPLQAQQLASACGKAARQRRTRGNRAARRGDDRNVSAARAPASDAPARYGISAMTACDRKRPFGHRLIRGLDCPGATPFDPGAYASWLLPKGIE